VTSFFTILMMWVNHHRLFTHIGRCDDPLLFYNGLPSLGVAGLPFPTALVAETSRSRLRKRRGSAHAVRGMPAIISRAKLILADRCSYEVTAWRSWS
jgi:uncharacterized membrane protein